MSPRSVETCERFVPAVARYAALLPAYHVAMRRDSSLSFRFGGFRRTPFNVEERYWSVFVIVAKRERAQ